MPDESIRFNRNYVLGDQVGIVLGDTTNIVIKGVTIVAGDHGHIELETDESTTFGHAQRLEPNDA